MNLDHLAKQLAISNPHVVDKAKELLRLSSIKISGGLGQVSSPVLEKYALIVVFTSCWVSITRFTNMKSFMQGEICKAAVCLELACLS